MNFTSFKNKIYDKKGLIDYDWMSKNLILCQKKLNEKTKYNFFFKTHSVRHKSFTNETVNAGFIYIVRDPRDVIVSLSNFTGINLDEAINQVVFNKQLMTNANSAKELVSNWELNIKSWLEYKSVPGLFIRYEDLLFKSNTTILKIIDFINTITNKNILNNKNYIDKITQNTNFKTLQFQEISNGFDEASKHSKFFKSGTSNQWKDILSNTQVQIIYNNLQPLMNYFNYN
tara:strand:- start:19 stop:708 length:690 start_codon:yes stop_codon:yes gene_type:complete